MVSTEFHVDTPSYDVFNKVRVLVVSAEFHVDTPRMTSSTRYRFRGFDGVSRGHSLHDVFNKVQVFLGFD